MKSTNIFDACREGNIKFVKNKLSQDVDLSELNDYGLTALHCAAIGSDGTNPKINLEILKLLIEAGSELEMKSSDGRTALYLLAEFSQTIAPVQYLIDQGAETDIYDVHGNSIVENAMMPDVQELLSKLTGFAIPEEPEPSPEPVKMKSKNWKKAKVDIDLVFEKLNASNLIALQDAGYTQSDGFSDCSEAFYKNPQKDTIKGFCFYTRQDLERAKETSMLMLGYWGAPDGEDKSTESIGNLIIETFKQANFNVQWSGKASDRPYVLLHKYADKN